MLQRISVARRLHFLRVMETNRFLPVIHVAASTLLAFGAVVSFCISDTDLAGVALGSPFVAAAAVLGTLFTREVSWRTAIGGAAGTAAVTFAALAAIFVQLWMLDAMSPELSRMLAFEFSLGVAGAAIAGGITGSALVAGNRVRRIASVSTALSAV